MERILGIVCSGMAVKAAGACLAYIVASEAAAVLLPALNTVSEAIR